MAKKIIVPVDNFAQAGEATLAEIVAVAAGQGGNAAEVIRDPSTGKVIQVNVNLPDTAPQSAIDAISNNKGVATSLVLAFPTVLSDGRFNFDALSAGGFPASDANWAWARTDVGSAASPVVATDQFASSPNSLKFAFTGTGVAGLSINAAGGFANFLRVGRTVETEWKFRFSAAPTKLEFRPGEFFSTVEMDSSGDLTVTDGGASIVTGLAINTFHTLNIVSVVNSGVITVVVNGVPKGNFPVSIIGGSVYSQARVAVFQTPAVALDVHVDDIKITGIA